MHLVISIRPCLGDVKVRSSMFERCHCCIGVYYDCKLMRGKRKDTTGKEKKGKMKETSEKSAPHAHGIALPNWVQRMLWCDALSPQNMQVQHFLRRAPICQCAASFAIRRHSRPSNNARSSADAQRHLQTMPLTNIRQNARPNMAAA